MYNKSIKRVILSHYTSGLDENQHETEIMIQWWKLKLKGYFGCPHPAYIKQTGEKKTDIFTQSVWIIQWSFFYFQWDHYHVQCIMFFLVLHSALFFSFSVQSPYVLPNSVSLLHSSLLHLPLLWPFPIFSSSSLSPSLLICLPYTSGHLQVLVLSLTNFTPPSSLSPALHLQLLHFCSPSFPKLWNTVGGAHILQSPLLFSFSANTIECGFLNV